jgi:polysaccharide biosynthesis protein PelC
MQRPGTTTTRRRAAAQALGLALLASALATCATGYKYHDKGMDFAAVKTVAVLPLANLSRDNLAGERVRDVFSNMLLATGSIYVLPPGEIARGMQRSPVAIPSAPSKDEVIALGKALAVEGVITGVLKEYGEIRSGNSAGNVISVSLEMFETTTGKVVWSASTTKGGIGFWDRLLGGGGEPMDKVTESAVHELLGKLFNQ